MYDQDGQNVSGFWYGFWYGLWHARSWSLALSALSALQTWLPFLIKMSCHLGITLLPLGIVWIRSTTYLTHISDGDECFLQEANQVSTLQTIQQRSKMAVYIGVWFLGCSLLLLVIHSVVLLLIRVHHQRSDESAVLTHDLNCQYGTHSDRTSYIELTKPEL